MMAQHQKNDLGQPGDCFTIIFAAPILPGRSEVWRRWLQELIESRRPEYEESRRRLGVSGEQVWIAETVNGNVAVIAVVAALPEQVLAQLAASDRPFDSWYRAQLLALQGFDLTRPLGRASPELVLEWHTSKNQEGEHSMSTEQHTSMVRRWVEGGWNQGNLALVDELFAADYMIHDPQVPDFPGGQAAFKQFVTNLRTPFADIRVTIEDMVAEGDKVVWRWRITGTHTGDLMGIPATGKPVTMTGIVVSHFVHGKWAEDYVNWDTVGMLQQVGAIPMPGQSGS